MRESAPYWIEPGSPADNFPSAHDALSQPDGLLCFGGDLSEQRLLYAYKNGIFPWPHEQQPITWWSPSPRCVIYPHELVIRRSLKKKMRNGNYNFSMDRAFDNVIKTCAAPRDDETDTWITPNMQRAYSRLHRRGHAHSAEIWRADELVGGLYGVAIGRVFFGESMFSHVADGSKMALACLTKRLQKHGFKLIDAQLSSAHLLTLGAREMTRSAFLHVLNRYCQLENTIKLWQTKPMSVREYFFNL